MTDITNNTMQAKTQRKPLYLNAERCWVLIFALFAIFVTMTPYLFGYFTQGDTWRFTGFVLGVEDGNSYIAKMLRGSVGDWLFRTPYSAFPQNGVFVYFPYILLGKLVAPPYQHEKLILIYQFARMIAGIAMILATYDFLAVYVKGVKARRWALAFAILGGGAGWLLIILGLSEWLDSLPLEFYSPEAFGFISLFGLPHLAMARALMLWGFVFYLKGDKKNNGIYAGLLWLIAGLFQPLRIVVAWAVIGSHILYLGIQELWQNRKSESVGWFNTWPWFVRGVGAVIISSPIVFYTLVAFSLDPVIKQWTSQNIILSPHPLHYGLAFGLVLFLALIGLWRSQKPLQPKEWLLVVWVLIFPFLVYAPYPLQRRFSEAFWVALLALVFLAFERFDARVLRWGKYVLLLCLPSTLFLFAGGFLSVSKSEVPLFRPKAEVAAFNFLAEYTDGEAVVLSSYETGNPMPAWAPVFVVIGHGPETIHLHELEPRVEAFYQGKTEDIQRLKLLEEFDVNYVFWGPAEQELGDWDPSYADYLTRVYQGNGYNIYQVNLAD